VQQALRNLLISEYGECQVTGTQCATTLEACHIIPVKDEGSDNIGNALLLRRDIHALFDSGLLRFQRVNEHWVVALSTKFVDRQYEELRGKRVAKILPSCSVYLDERTNLEDAG
jgi:predicted restriction endonuclease